MGGKLFSVKRYGGTLIHTRRDEYGVMEVVESSIERSLHFGTPPVQSSMLLHDPTFPYLSYTRAMLVALLFQPQPRRILMVGLGGGSLVRFLRLQFPNAVIEVVELRAQVVELAQRYFNLSADPKLQLWVGDIADYAPPQHRYDLILIDAFDHEGIATAVTDTAFFHYLREVLAATGVITMNLWVDDSLLLRQMQRQMESLFERNGLRLTVPGKANQVLLLGGEDQPLQRQLPHLKPTALNLQLATRVEFLQLYQRLQQQNRWNGWSLW